jgi:phosphatidylserine decarboxylase
VKDGLVITALSLVPRNHAAWWMGAVARLGLTRPALRLFAWTYGVDVEEASRPLSAYPSLEAFFTRELRPGARPIAEVGPGLVSPCDSRVAFVGPSEGGKISLAPGRQLDLEALLGRPLNGEVEVLVLYLSPKDYHRVHSPLRGRATRWTYRPGTLWPVFPAAVRRIDDLFARNERVVIRLEAEAGPLDLVLVGAFGVGRISTALDSPLTNTGAPAAGGTADLALGPGDWLGTFHLGSTVVLVSRPGAWRPLVQAGQALRMGQPLAEGRVG